MAKKQEPRKRPEVRPPPPCTGEQLAAARERLGMTQEEFAAWLDITPARLAAMESGRRPVWGPIRYIVAVLDENGGKMPDCWR
ncbi:MAG TPA: helix-turn-helix transcriptional regulator [Gemmataceae bacterium]|nr:helix-turn-helix transcriptional regulator [Gemmataceae bacterium]